MKALCLALLLAAAGCDAPPPPPVEPPPPTPAQQAATHCPGAVEHSLAYGAPLSLSASMVETCVTWFGQHASAAQLEALACMADAALPEELPEPEDDDVPEPDDEDAPEPDEDAVPVPPDADPDVSPAS